MRRGVGRDLVEDERLALARLAAHVAQHLRRLAQNHAELDVDRLRAGVLVRDDKAPVVGGGAKNGERAAFPLAELLERCKVLGREDRKSTRLNSSHPSISY